MTTHQFMIGLGIYGCLKGYRMERNRKAAAAVATAEEEAIKDGPSSALPSAEKEGAAEMSAFSDDTTEPEVEVELAHLEQGR